MRESYALLWLMCDYCYLFWFMPKTEKTANYFFPFHLINFNFNLLFDKHLSIRPFEAIHTYTHTSHQSNHPTIPLHTSEAISSEQNWVTSKITLLLLFTFLTNSLILLLFTLLLLAEAHKVQYIRSLLGSYIHIMP